MILYANFLKRRELLYTFICSLIQAIILYIIVFYNFKQALRFIPFLEVNFMMVILILCLDQILTLAITKFVAF